MRHFVKPELRGEQASLAEHFRGRKRRIVMHELIHLEFDGGLLPVGANCAFAETPQVIHRVEVRTAVGQPQELDVEILGQRLGLLVLVGGVFIQEQRHRLGAVVPADEIQKLLEFQPAVARPLHEQKMTAAQMQGAKEGSASVLAGDKHRGGLAPQSPTRAQRRKEQQVGFILRQERGGRRQSPYLPQNPAFFSPPPGPGPVRSGSVSRRNLRPSTAAATWRSKLLVRDDKRSGRLGAAAHSRCWLDSPVPPDAAPKRFPPGSPNPRSSWVAAPDRGDPPTQPGVSGGRQTVAPNDECCSGPRAATAPLALRTGLDRATTRPTLAGKAPHRGFALTPLRGSDVVPQSNSHLSSVTVTRPVASVNTKCLIYFAYLLSSSFLNDSKLTLQ